MDCAPEAMSAVFQNLAASQIKTLKLYGLSIPRGFDQCIGHLVDLQDLNIKCLDAPSRALADGLTSNSEKEKSAKSCATSLQRMTMSAFASIPLQLGRILALTTNLRQLDLRATASAMTDNVMRVICCYLDQLTHLNLRGCHQLTAFGFLGPEHKDAPTDTLVENDFVNFVDTGHNISNLRKLVNLNISGLKIGDDVFEHLKCKDLRVLNVSGNLFITSKGFQLMVDNNPRIVWFVASKCSQLEDTSVIHMLKAWKRLVRLEINKNICLNGEFVNHLGSAEAGKYLTHVSANKLGVRQSESINFKRGGQILRHHSEGRQILSDNEELSNDVDKN